MYAINHGPSQGQAVIQCLISLLFLFFVFSEGMGVGMGRLEWGWHSVFQFYENILSLCCLVKLSTPLAQHKASKLVIWGVCRETSFWGILHFKWHFIKPGYTQH